MKRSANVAVGFLATTAVAGMLVSSAWATKPGANGKIAFSGQAPGASRCIHVIDPDGTDLTPIGCPTNGGQGQPEWFPDGSRVAYDVAGVYSMKPDGSDRQFMFDESEITGMSFSPDGTMIVYSSSFCSPTFGCFEGVLIRSLSDPNSYTTLQGAARQPDWSPDGALIALVKDGDMYTIHPDGTGLTNLTNTPTISEYQPSWSPDGSKLAFGRPDPGGIPQVYVMNRDGSGQTQLTHDPSAAGSPAWSPDGTKIAFLGRLDGQVNTSDLYTMDADGTDPLRLTSDILELDPSWQSIPINSYPRPKGATPFLTYLVPAYNACAAPNRTHGPSLAFPSCNPPTQSSNALTVGSADSNGKPTKSVSSVRFDTLVGIPSTTADEADVKITAQVIDVYTQAGLNDYAGELTAKTTLRITDKLNTPHPGGPGAGTVSDIPYGFTIPCAETADTTIGGSCQLSTSADALAPGAVTEGKRSIWALGQVAVYDANDAPFMKQGIFVP
jgi:hypothetical protein